MTLMSDCEVWTEIWEAKKEEDIRGTGSWVDLRVLSYPANTACIYKQDTWSLWVSGSSFLKKYTTIAKLRNPVASFPACKSDKLAEKHVLEFLLPRASMKSPGLRALCGGKGIHPFRSPEAHLVNESRRCCGGIPVCHQQALLETGSFVQVPGCWEDKG